MLTKEQHADLIWRTGGAKERMIRETAEGLLEIRLVMPAPVDAWQMFQLAKRIEEITSEYPNLVKAECDSEKGLYHIIKKKQQ